MYNLIHSCIQMIILNSRSQVMINSLIISRCQHVCHSCVQVCVNTALRNKGLSQQWDIVLSPDVCQATFCFTEEKNHYHISLS